MLGLNTNIIYLLPKSITTLDCFALLRFAPKKLGSTRTKGDCRNTLFLRQQRRQWTGEEENG